MDGPPDGGDPDEGSTSPDADLIADHDADASDAAAPRRQVRETSCRCGQGPHPCLTPLAWRRAHGVDLLDLEARRKVNEITALKSGRRIIDLPEAS
jgi:hypothetical protein